MQLAVASGKGGTGKTTISTALFQTIQSTVSFLDCDVEEPNAAIFLKPRLKKREPVTAIVPFVNEDICTGCGECASFCEFNALITIGGHAIVFPELCHSCDGCFLVCPNQALSKKEKQIGKINSTSDTIPYIGEGRLTVGNAMAPPVIRQLKASCTQNAVTILDCPPGISCPMITTVKGADFVILVTEPTPFGLHDLKLAVETVRDLTIPLGVVINRANVGDSRVVDYCDKENISILLQINESIKIAQAYSNGKNIAQAEPTLKKRFKNMLTEIENLIEKCKK